MVAPTRPILRWHGGKWRLAPWIIQFFPEHRTYVEPFGGAASVLLRKERSYSEVYNDLDDGVVNLFRLIRDEALATRLVDLLQKTPFARREFEQAYEMSDDPIEEARRLIVRSFMGFGSDGHNRAVRTGFRANSSRSRTTPAHDWANYPEKLRMIVTRLKGVVIEGRDAADVMAQHDRETTLHYVDPPYLPETRSQKSRRGKIQYHAYAHEMTADDHRRLLEFLIRLDGMVVLSGSDSALYHDMLGEWVVFRRQALADGARPRTECLWINPRCISALNDGPLFQEADL